MKVSIDNQILLEMSKPTSMKEAIARFEKEKGVIAPEAEKARPV